MLSYEDFMKGYAQQRSAGDVPGASSASGAAGGVGGYEKFMEGFYQAHPDRRPAPEPTPEPALEPALQQKPETPKPMMKKNPPPLPAAPQKQEQGGIMREVKNFVQMSPAYFGQAMKHSVQETGNAVAAEVGKWYNPETLKNDKGVRLVTKIMGTTPEELFTAEGEEKLKQTHDQTVDFTKKNQAAMDRDQQKLQNKFANQKGAGAAAARWVGGGLGSMVPQIAAGAVNPMLASQLIYGQGVGSYYGQALQDGAQAADAYKAGVAGGAVNTAIEKTFGGVPMAGKGMVPVGELAQQYAKSSFGKTMLNRLAESTGEGLEEVVENVLQPAIQKVTYGKELDWPTLQENLDAFMGGFAASLVSGAALEDVPAARRAMKDQNPLESLLARGGRKAADADASNTAAVEPGQPLHVVGNAETGLAQNVPTAQPAGPVKMQDQGIMVGDPGPVAGTIQPKAGTDGPSAGTVQPEADTVPLQSSAKSLDIQQMRTNRFVQALGDSLNVPVGAQRDFLKPIGQELSESVKQTGHVDKALADRLFDTAYEQGRVVEREYYDTYKDLKDELRHTAVTLDRESANSAEARILRGELNRRNLVRVNDHGIPVDASYQDLSERYPELFPQDIVNPLDQLNQMGEVARGIQKIEKDLDAYYGEEAEDFKMYARHDFDEAITQLTDDLMRVRRLEADNAQQAAERQAAIDKARNTPELGEVQAQYEAAKKLQREADKIMGRSALTRKDKMIVEGLLKGTLTMDEKPLMESDNMAEVLEVYQARRAVQDAMRPINEFKRARAAALQDEVQQDLEGTETWVDKKHGLQYSTETMERNIADISKGDLVGQNMVRDYIKPVHAHEADATRFKNEWRDKMRALDLNEDESIYLQMRGELDSYESLRQKRRGKLPDKDAAAGDQLAKAMDDHLKTRGNHINRDKVEAALPVFRQAYDSIFKQMNQIYIENGYAPIDYRRGYFPHFTDSKPDTLVQKIAASMGVDLKADQLPTDIAGLTHTFKPGRRWNPFAKERIGLKTDYDALRGFDKYLDVAADVIYHTNDIRRLRALEEGIRFKYSDEGTKAEIEKVRMDDNLTPDERMDKIRELSERSKGQLSGFVQEVGEYTNLLAGKKSLHDRTVEKDFGRNVYQMMGALESRVAANMVAINPGSWITNFIPITQASAECSTESLLKGAWDQAKSLFRDDGFKNESDFLTNRAGSDPLTQTTMQKVSGTLSSPMQWIDDFTAGTIVRAKAAENMAKGMPKFEAIEEADAYAASLMADRSKGSLPTIFGRKNPVTRLLTMYQVEVNNQLRYLGKDLPRNIRKGMKQPAFKKELAKALTRYSLGAYLYNELYELLTGRRSAFDPLGIANEAMGDFAGVKLPNVAKETKKALKGEASVQDFTTEKKPASAALGNLGKNIAEELPFVGGLLNGGRVPISSALPSVGKLSGSVADLISGDQNPRAAMQNITKELAKPAAYLLPPVGGGQIKKAVEGLGTVARGGSYKVNSEGVDQLQFAVENPGPGTYAKAALFGKWALPGGQEYIESGKAKSPAYTEAYKAGIPISELNKLLPSGGKQPGYAQSIGGDQAAAVDELLDTLTEQTGTRGLKQSAVPGTMTVNGESVKLSGPQQVDYSRARNEASYNILESLLDSTLSPEYQAAVAKSAQQYAGQVAREQVMGEEPDKWVATMQREASGADQLAEMMLARAIVHSAKSIKNGRGKTIENSRRTNARKEMTAAGISEVTAQRYWELFK